MKNTDPKPTAIELVANNLINGNLADAKRAAGRRSFAELRAGFIEYGWTSAHATAAAEYLKHPNPTTWQAYCDAARVI